MEMVKNEKKIDYKARKKPSIVDIKLSWHLLKKNFKYYGRISFFSFIGTLIIIFIILIIYHFMLSSINGVVNGWVINSLYRSIPILVPLGFLLFWAFYESGYGLTYDIMSTGDDFAESKGGFYYFQNFWWQNILIAFITNFSTLFIIFPIIDLNRLTELGEVVYFIIIICVNFIFYLVFFFVLPSLTAKGSLSKAFEENFMILRKNPKRIFISTFLLYIIFEVPIGILLVFYFTLVGLQPGNIDTFPFIIIMMIAFCGYFLANSMHNLVATRIYSYYIEDFGKKDESISIKNIL